MSKLIIGMLYNLYGDIKLGKISGNINLITESITITAYFNHDKKIHLAFADSTGDLPRSIDDIATITFSFKTEFENEHHIKKKIMNDASYAIGKRRNEIDFLEKDREVINNKIVNIKTPENDIKEHYKEIELINEQIRNHHKEIELIKESLTKKIEVGDVINEYEFKLERNYIHHINGIEDQKIPFSIFWCTEKDIGAIMDPIRSTVNNVKTLHISYDTIMNNISI